MNSGWSVFDGMTKSVAKGLESVKKTAKDIATEVCYVVCVL